MKDVQLLFIGNGDLYMNMQLSCLSLFINKKCKAFVISLILSTCADPPCIPCSDVVIADISTLKQIQKERNRPCLG